MQDSINVTEVTVNHSDIEHRPHIIFTVVANWNGKTYTTEQGFIYDEVRDLTESPRHTHIAGVHWAYFNTREDFLEACGRIHEQESHYRNK